MKPNYLATPRRVIKKTIGGISFDDPYDWLQKDTDEALIWQARQNALAESELHSWEGFEDLREAIQRSIPAVDSPWASIPKRAGGRWFRLDKATDGNGEALWVSDSPISGGEPIMDTTHLQTHLKTERAVHIVQFVPASDGSRVVLSLTIGGDANEYFRIIETARAQILESGSYQHPYQAGFPTWLPDGSGYFLAGERHEDGNHCIRFIQVTRNAPSYPDALFNFEAVPENMPILTPQISPRGRYIIAVSGPHEWTAVQIGDLRTGTWRRFVPDDFSGECYGNWIDDGHYVAVVSENSPRGRVVIIPASTSQDRNTWKEIIPQTELVMRNLIVTEDRLVLVGLQDISLCACLYHFDGTQDGRIPLEPFSYSSLTNRFLYVTRANELVFSFGTFTRQELLYHYRFDSHDLELLGAPGEVLADLIVSQQFATCKDGTKIPYFMVYRKGIDLRRLNPVLIHGYGGFNDIQLPEYLGPLTPFVRAGGIYILANLRGGAEYGSEWYEAGRLMQKQNTFDDLYAIAEDLIHAGTTSPAKLAFYGRSNGGLTAGVAIVQRPDLWRVVVPVVPLLDMMEPVLPGPVAEALRSYLVEDYGDPGDPDFAPVIYSYSPYHNLRKGVNYPAVLLVFGEKDLGCPPYHGRKFVARLQAATASDHPVLFRVWEDVGHHAVGPESITQFAEFLGFIMRELGMNLHV